MLRIHMKQNIPQIPPRKDKQYIFNWKDRTRTYDYIAWRLLIKGGCFPLAW